jgi:molecular chaperone GrpE (heat shock protein)
MLHALSRGVAEATASAQGVERSDADADFEFNVIESCLTSTERGRRFLNEFARRRRAEDSARILAAIDRLESRALRHEIDRIRERLETERVGDVASQLSKVLKALRPVADALTRARTMEEPPARATALERRFAALVQLDGQNAEQAAEQGLKLFG